MIESRQYQRSEICGVFHVPPHMIGDVSGTNKATAEQVGCEFVNYTLSPWLSAWQQELRRKLLPAPQVGRNAGKKYIVLFDTRRLTFPDGESRSKFYASGKQWGYFSSNDIREMEDENPIDSKEADEYWMPVNMIPMTDPKPAAQLAQPTQTETKSARSNHHLFGVFTDAFKRYSVREKKDFNTLKRAFEPVLSALSEASQGTAKAEQVESHLFRMFVRSTEWESDSAGTEWSVALEAFKTLEQAQ